MKITLAAAACIFVLAISGCSAGTGTNKPQSEEPALRAAVQKYSDAYLTGDADTAYSLLSNRCKKLDTPDAFALLVSQAKLVYGSALPIKTFKAHIEGDLARVTYTYDLKAINQEDQPWTKESSDWHDDNC